MSADPSHNSKSDLPHRDLANPSTVLGGSIRETGEASHPETVAVGVVHDLANMLTIVPGNLERLRWQPLDEAGQHELDRAEWGTRQAGRLAHQLLSSLKGTTKSRPP